MTVFAVRLRRCFNGDWGLVGLVGHGSEEARKRSSGAKYINISAPAPLTGPFNGIDNGMPFEAKRKSLQLFIDEVMPAFT